MGGRPFLIKVRSVIVVLIGMLVLVGGVSATTITATVGGDAHSLALKSDKSDGAVWAWRLNNFDELVDETITGKLTPVQVLIKEGYYEG